MTRGLFVTFEGGEGAGKSTLVNSFCDALRASAQEVVLTREPGGTHFGEELRSVVLYHKHEVSPIAELFLFLAARIQHLDEVIKPALARGAIVLCDRYTDSTIAYQGVGRDLGVDYVTKCCTLATGGFDADLTLYVDIDPKIGLARTHKRQNGDKGIDRLEKEALEFHERVRSGFLALAKKHPDRIAVLDGTLSPDALFEDAYTIFQQRR